MTAYLDYGWRRAQGVAPGAFFEDPLLISSLFLACVFGFLVFWFCSVLLGSAKNKAFRHHTKSRDDLLGIWLKIEPPGYGPQVLAHSNYQGKPCPTGARNLRVAPLCYRVVASLGVSPPLL